MSADEQQELSRRERERRWRRSLILEAAEELFSTRGYHATSVQQIAEQAEFSVGFLYNMFENKEDIYHRLADWRWEEYHGQIRKGMEEAQDEVEAIRALVTAKLEFFREHRQFFDIFVNLCAVSPERRPPPLSSEWIERYLEYQSELEDVFRSGVERGVFADLDPAAAVVTVEGVTNAIIRRWSRPVEEERELIGAETIERILFNGLLAEGQHHE